MSKYFLVCTGNKPVCNKKLKVMLASKRYGHGDLAVLSDGVAMADVVKRFLKAGYILSISEDKFKELSKGDTLEYLDSLEPQEEAKEEEAKEEEIPKEEAKKEEAPVKAPAKGKSKNRGKNK